MGWLEDEGQRARARLDGVNARIAEYARKESISIDAKAEEESTMTTAARTYTGLPNAKHYSAKFRNGQPKPTVEMSGAEAQHELMRRVRCYIEERPGVDIRAARNAVLSDDEDLRRVACPLPEERPPDESQPARAARHQDQLAAQLIREKKAKTYGEAVRMADGLAPGVAAKARSFAGPAPAVPLHGEARTLPRDVLVRQIATAALKQGLTRPGPDGRAMADQWLAWNFKAPPAGSGKALLDSYNTLRERTVNEIVEAARALLADPAERAKLHP